MINIATASQVSVTTKEFRPGPYEIRPYFGNQYINTISNMPSGRNLDVLIDSWENFISACQGKRREKTDLWKAALQGTDGRQTAFSRYELLRSSGQASREEEIRGYYKM